MINPSVFLSYSHDSEAHKAWVRKLGEDLRAQGVDATLDQWDLRPGADVVAFMEAGIRGADRVLMVCSSNYLRKAEERKGGAGYEGLIVTSHVARSTDTVKFIPLVRNNPAEPLVPDFLGPRLWLDFRDDALYAERLEDLVRELHAVPRFTKPPLGRPSFLSDPAEVVAAAQPTAVPPAEEPQPVSKRQRVQATQGQLLRQGDEWRLEKRAVEMEGYLEELAEGGVALTMVKLPAGTFLMGSSPLELEHAAHEGPHHEVQVREFFLAQTPITQAQWRAVALWPKVDRLLNPDPSDFKGPNLPVEQVSWFDAMEFCRRLSQRTGNTYGLPSEAQWEYACRAGTTTPFHFGVTLTPQLANYKSNSSYGNGPLGSSRPHTTKVGTFPANAWGLHDMHGNVWEYCEDHWHAGYGSALADDKPWLIPASGRNEPRVHRGGSWRVNPGHCRSAFRGQVLPDLVLDYHGLRVCSFPPGPTS